MCKKFISNLLGAGSMPQRPAQANETVDKNEAEAEIKGDIVQNMNPGGEASGRVKLGGRRRQSGVVPGLGI